MKDSVFLIIADGFGPSLIKIKQALLEMKVRWADNRALQMVINCKRLWAKEDNQGL